MRKKVVIVGGVAAGASTAARLRRLDEKAEIVMLERGEYISFANCGLPYYAGGVIENRKRLLVQTPQSMYSRFNIDVRTMSEVQHIFPQEKQVQVKNLLQNETYNESYDYLVLCPGASPVIPDIPGINQPNVFIMRNLPDSDAVKQYIEMNHPARAVVVGGGFIGLEIAEMLEHSGADTTIVEAAPQVMKVLDPEMAAIVHKYLSHRGVELCLGQKVVALEGESRVETVVLDNGERLPTDLVVMGVGVKPNVNLARQAGLDIGSTGGILVDEYLRTSDPYIYAAGDAIQVKDFVTGIDAQVPMAGPANRQGWLAANNIAGNPSQYTGAQGTAIVKIFDMAAAATGQNEKNLRSLGRDFKSCHLLPASHATYYPHSTEMNLKLIFTPVEGKILGAQIVGYEGVDKRIDVIATAIRAGMTVFDLQELELAYAPPFSSAKDPVNLAGYAAANIVRQDVEITSWDDVPAQVAAGAFLIDARTRKEYEIGHIEGCHNIPVDKIRDSLENIPRDKEILVYCRSGLRSYIACRILKQHGYNTKNIDGGYNLYE